MREAMAHAQVGDDVYGEDPTVNALEARAATKTGKEAALFVSSGTMSNLIAILSHATRGDEAIVGDAYHTYCWEAGGMATLGGVVPHPLPVDQTGRMALADIEGAVRGDDPHWPRSRLVLVENSVGGRYGNALPPDYFADVAQITQRHGLALHLDGARLFNAATALGIDAREITQHVDSVSICLSKGLCAPAGSLLCGSAELIHLARRMRKSLGGGMRQAGILAAAGLIALDEMTLRLAEDHAHACQLAEGLAQIPGIHVDVDRVMTNMVFFELADDVPVSADTIAQRMQEKANIWVGAESGRHFRAVTHYWIGSAEVDAFLTTLRAVL
jgi:threonine aldolase